MLLHQADWIAGNLHGIWDTSDYNNVLKLGYDPGAEEFPKWLASQVRDCSQAYITMHSLVLAKLISCQRPECQSARVQNKLPQLEQLLLVLSAD